MPFIIALIIVLVVLVIVLPPAAAAERPDALLHHFDVAVSQRGRSSAGQVSTAGHSVKEPLHEAYGLIPQKVLEALIAVPLELVIRLILLQKRDDVVCQDGRLTIAIRLAGVNQPPFERCLVHDLDHRLKRERPRCPQAFAASERSFALPLRGGREPGTQKKRERHCEGV